MIELTIFGRGGQGGVTLAKLIATAHFLKDKHVQAFGVYAAERSGAPLHAYVRIDDQEITNHNQISTPDHVIVLDRTLIGPNVITGHRLDGWIVLNTPEPPEAFAELFPGRNVATIDATEIAVANGLGTRAVPIVNTTILGAAAHVFDMTMDDVEAALAHVRFGGANVTSARQAFEEVQRSCLEGKAVVADAGTSDGRVVGLLDEDTGQMPRIKTGSWATQKPERQTLTPPCNYGCPAGNDVRGFVEAIGREEYDKSVEILLETSPLPAVCGRVCPAPCMDACNRQLFDEAVNIRELERYAAEHGTRPDPVKPHRKERIGVIGSGPAGLSAAYHLARLGYPTTIFEGGEELGGVLRTGIPAYRLPREILGEEIAYILRHGVEVKTGCFVSRERLLQLTHEYAALFVGTGLSDSRTLNLGGMCEGFVEQGIDFLDSVRSGQRRIDGRNVIVIGGGNTAIDAARSALRVGAHHVAIVYRRTRTEMPAIKEEIDEAIEEGIELRELVSPLRLERRGRAAVLTCQRMILGEPDESGRPRPVPDTTEGTQFDLKCDLVILALGQYSDMSILPEGAEIHDNGKLLGLSGAPIFAGGDFSTSDGTVTAAIGSGRRGALHIHNTLTGENLFPPKQEPLAEPELISTHIFSRSPRQESVMLEPDRRRRTFAEVRVGLIDVPDNRAAIEEAARCFSCGVCNQCDRCVDYCPEGIVLRDGDSYKFDYSYCKGCGLCASQCPRGVIYMAEL